MASSRNPTAAAMHDANPIAARDFRCSKSSLTKAQSLATRSQYSAIKLIWLS